MLEEVAEGTAGELFSSRGGGRSSVLPGIARLQAGHPELVHRPAQGFGQARLACQGAQ
ncbi:MAG: hypothetical protein HY319_32865 [Armatimonadetes bacterium]|nr:hypothetical protein [Armatimonadota bacterium]